LFLDVAGVMDTGPPANEVQQVVGIGAQRCVGEATNVFAVQVAINPADLLPAGLLDDANRTLSVVRVVLVNYAELHG
jgi:hypothetical protein